MNCKITEHLPAQGSMHALSVIIDSIITVVIYLLSTFINYSLNTA